MSSHSCQSKRSGKYPSVPSKKRLAKDQLRLLETSFNTNQKLTTEVKFELARELGLPPRQVAIWYQNRRARRKADTMEDDYKKIQMDLGDVLAGNIRLDKEVGKLRKELNEAQQLLLASTSTATTFPSATAPCNDHPTSNTPGNIICNWEMPLCSFRNQHTAMVFSVDH
ncbi:hypothetical protein Tsubulata_042246 [Turnera subulata]|uniref:Homeobox-leucine zipper protein n=1 Tax=Turnera subulata TaxID=218843 RepID=A0A9Q0J5F9_9ROSI|nr:hypothetical protein Tsubulata_042246 [Turnera subulata]